MKIIKRIILLLVILIIGACTQEDKIEPNEYSGDVKLLKLELSYEGVPYATTIYEDAVSMLNTLPFQAQEVTVKTLEISEGATASINVGDLISVGDSPISVVITSENGSTTKTYTLELTTKESQYNFTTNNHFILSDNIRLDIKGVIYTPNYPGYYPWDIEREVNLPAAYESSILSDIINIKSMGANTIRLWGAPKYTYEAIKQIGDLYFLQTIWIDSEQADFQDETFKNGTKAYIREIIDRVYSVYTDNAPPLIAYIVGNELSESSINSTNSSHPDINSYSGQYINASEINASQAFIAEMADYVKTYEFETYGNISLVSYANDIRTPDIIDVPFLDFRCHNAYSYAVPYFRPSTKLGSSSGTLFQGWVEEQKSKYPEIPLLISETGLSISPDAARIGPPNYGYGGNTEADQAEGIIQNINDINTAEIPIAGVCIHEYLDAWWKFGAVDTQETNQPEEWFGLVSFTPSGDWYETEFRESYFQLQNIWK